jgi:hypothetical protein
MPAKLYNTIFLSFFTVLALVVTFFVFWLDPYVGDLARIGAYMENEYGWNEPQKKFRTPFYTIGENINDYDQHFDIVTIGDSFSVNHEQSWQNYLALSSNSSIITFHRRSVSLDEIIKHPYFVKSPPELFIFEVVEHGIQTVLHNFSPPKQEEINPANSISQINFQEIEYSTFMESYPRNKSSQFSMDTALHFIKTNIKQRLGSRTKAYPKLITGKELLFSNANTESALFYHLDNLKLSISENEWAVIEQRFAAAQSIVQDNNKTTFLAMVAPDKRTAYRHLIKDEGNTYQSAIEMMPGKYKVNWIDTLGGLRYMIDQEVIDVYLPNDIHWGYQGYKAAFISTKKKIQSLSSK